jgi:hypothetical protein
VTAVPLVEIAAVIRSKNAGPYELTLDVVFTTQEWYERVVAARALTAEVVARAYGVPVEDVLHLVEFAPAAAIKATLRRPLVCGDPGETDVYGAQQHAPLLALVLDLP